MLVRLLLFFGILGTLHAETIQFQAEAYDLYTARFLYTENHIQVWDKGKHISSEMVYKDKDNKVFARKFIEYGSNPLVPDFSLDDERTGYHESLKKSDKSVILKFRKDRKTSLKEAALPVVPHSVAEGGFNYFIQENFDSLLKGRSLHGIFFMPNKLESFRCFITKVKDSQIQDRPIATFRMTLSNWFLRLFVDDILVTYDVQSRKLLFYEGISNIEDETHTKNYRVRIHFNYPKNFLDTASN